MLSSDRTSSSSQEEQLLLLFSFVPSRILPSFSRRLLYFVLVNLNSGIMLAFLLQPLATPFR